MAQSTIALAVVVALGGTKSPGADLHLSPSGDDRWTGLLSQPNADRSDGPLASLAGARDAIRRMGSRQQPVRVLIADGTYPMREPLVLEPRDGGTQRAPVTYEAVAGAHPLFTGGAPIGGWKAEAPDRWTATLDRNDPDWTFEELWNGRRRLSRARVPERGFMQMLAVEEESTRPEAERTYNGRKMPLRWARDTFRLSDADFRLLIMTEETEISGAQVVVYHKWDVTRRPVETIDSKSRTVSVVGGGMTSWNKWERGTRFYIDNWPGGPRGPGQWYRSSRGELTYWPRSGERMEDARFVAPKLAKLVEFRGRPETGDLVANLRFRGLSFCYTQHLTPPRGTGPGQAANGVGACIDLRGARNIVFEGCEVAHTGQYGVWFREGCSDCEIRETFFHDLGAGGVRIGPAAIVVPGSGLETRRIKLENNIIADGGKIFPDAVGIWVGQSSENRISHNLISGFDYSGISVGWTWGYGPSLAKNNRIEFNRISHIGRELLSDMGGIYTLGISDGTTIANNVIHDVRSAEYGGWGIYLDEGSSGITVSRNLVYCSEDGGFHQNYGRENTVTNNIFAFGKTGELRLFRPEKHRSLTFERNIVYWDKGPLFTGKWEESLVLMDHNIYWNTARDPIAWGKSSWPQWQANGHDRHSRVADPKFVDAEQGNFRLRWLSPARRVGFVPFNYGAAGVHGDSAWVALARQVESAEALKASE